ncbi:hypothetical protein EJ73_00382 [Hoylesella shahii DSM 15611 = JCM 12083]|uniref:Uncharacterized protein n=1 Tax=Hoylesella shahii DSM 15611 = JCM 12083 TaxID=1122991 RepID=A0A318IHL4_9BACT|nr:hypothetical protein EJ73_00382 [Hoylesella shahii DSM 15611 = JCM 12083]
MDFYIQLVLYIVLDSFSNMIRYASIMALFLFIHKGDCNPLHSRNL